MPKVGLLNVGSVERLNNPVFAAHQGRAADAAGLNLS